MAKYNDVEHKLYEASLKTLRDNFSAYQCANEEGKVEGIKEGIVLGEQIGIDKNRIETATTLKQQGVSIEIIIIATGLTKEVIEKL